MIVPATPGPRAPHPHPLSFAKTPVRIILPVSTNRKINRLSLLPWFCLDYVRIYVNQVNRSTQLVSAPVELEKVPGMQGVHVEATAARAPHGVSIEPRQSIRPNVTKDVDSPTLMWFGGELE